MSTTDEKQNGQIFSNIPLPYDLCLEIFARVPYRYHPSLQLVCRTWSEAVRSPELRLARTKCSTLEEWVFLVGRRTPLLEQAKAVVVRDRSEHGDFSVYGSGIPDGNLELGAFDPEQRRFYHCGKIPISISSPLNTRPVGPVAAGGGRFLVMFMPGTISTSAHSKKTSSSDPGFCALWRYDSLLNNWQEGARMICNQRRGPFACSSIDGKVYVAGGHIGASEKGDAYSHNFQYPLSSAEVYDPINDEWQALPPLRTPMLECRGVGVDGKLYVMGFSGRREYGRLHDLGPMRAEVFDIEKWEWEVITCSQLLESFEYYPRPLHGEGDGNQRLRSMMMSRYFDQLGTQSVDIGSSIFSADHSAAQRQALISFDCTGKESKDLKMPDIAGGTWWPFGLAAANGELLLLGGEAEYGEKTADTVPDIARMHLRKDGEEGGRNGDWVLEQAAELSGDNKMKEIVGCVTLWV